MRTIVVFIWMLNLKIKNWETVKNLNAKVKDCIKIYNNILQENRCQV